MGLVVQGFSQPDHQPAQLTGGAAAAEAALREAVEGGVQEKAGAGAGVEKAGAAAAVSDAVEGVAGVEVKAGAGGGVGVGGGGGGASAGGGLGVPGGAVPSPNHLPSWAPALDARRIVAKTKTTASCMPSLTVTWMSNNRARRFPRCTEPVVRAAWCFCVHRSSSSSSSTRWSCSLLLRRSARRALHHVEIAVSPQCCQEEFEV